MNHWNDTEVFEAIKDGDKSAMSKLYLSHYGFLMHYGFRIVPNKIIVEECIQEMFIYIFEAGPKLGVVKNIKAYMFSALRRRILEKIISERKWEHSMDQYAKRTNIQFAASDILFRRESQNQKTQALIQILNNLPWRQREAIYLRYYNGLSTNEIGEIMGAANQTILNTLHQALKKLRCNVDLKNLVSSISTLLMYFMSSMF